MESFFHFLIQIVYLGRNIWSVEMIMKVRFRRGLKESSLKLRCCKRYEWILSVQHFHLGSVMFLWKPGLCKHGKLSADKWHTACTVSMVGILIRLWGGSEEGFRKRKMLINFLNLVDVVKLTHLQVLTPAIISSYHTFIHAYLKKKLELYPHQDIIPN